MLTTNEMLPLDRLRKLEKRRFLKERKGQVPVMDAETLRELCVSNDGYETPELNESLYAHFRGFQRIEGLERYCSLKALWLESNGLSKIENLENLTMLRCLYLGKNLIERIENLNTLRDLNTLDLSENRIQSLKGVANLPNLLSLNASRNCITSKADLQELAQCPLLNNIDISHNLIADPEVLSVFKLMPNLKALRITGNQVISNTRSFRKTYIAALPELSFLDRPIFPIERISVTAWQTGGVEAEREAKSLFVQQRNEERRSTLKEFRDWQTQVRERYGTGLDLEREQKVLQATPRSMNLGVTRSMAEKNAEECAESDARMKESRTDCGQTIRKALDKAKESLYWSASALPQLNQTHAISLDSQIFENEKSGELRSKRENKVLKASEATSKGARLLALGMKSPITAVEVEEKVTGTPFPIDQVAQSILLSGDEMQAARATNTVAEMTRVRESKIENSVLRTTTDTAKQNLSGRSEGSERHDTCAMSLFTEEPSIQPDLPPPPPKALFRSIQRGLADVEPRETWAQLQQRASTTPCQLRPHSLPSAFGEHDCEQIVQTQIESDNDNAIPVRALSRAEILLDLGKTQQQDEHSRLQQGVELYTNLCELD
ncbi:dynein assembly factor axonemal [Plasmopara halstedii]|uniref:Dynein assembly factor axonemal n=1 Tax=Plasmopara halstedii TaxID=4781 RepID=A0A0P1A620_PLAHL|nr:dynein assembly factor axonemal [Plasmopara halstedii]CEG35357.1 dynein assembly factor axonemal [Plasmopara halstedii]|eukprot:XP_024571726.1 dynein assembly factor axonemal [Plasmopara halstedii]